MADSKNTPAEAPSVSIDNLTAAFTAALKQVQPARETDPSEYMRRPDKLDPVLKRPVYQMGQPVQIRGCSQDTINHLDNLVDGLYIDDMVKVEVRGKMPHQSVHITYNYDWDNRDQRMTFYSKVSSFSDMVAKIAKEQAAKSK
jgi:hypothetical protein